jgi:hypothetical protein
VQTHTWIISLATDARTEAAELVPNVVNVQHKSSIDQNVIKIQNTHFLNTRAKVSFITPWNVPEVPVKPNDMT